MNNPSGELMSVFFDNVEEILTGIAVMKVEWEFELLSQLKMQGKYLKLLLFGGIVKAIIVEPTFPNSYQF